MSNYSDDGGVLVALFCLMMVLIGGLVLTAWWSISSESERYAEDMAECMGTGKKQFECRVQLAPAYGGDD